MYAGYKVLIYILGKQQNEMRSPFGIGYDVVMRLMQPHLNRYHHVVLDNYFSSPTLCEALYRENTYMTGTTRVCRKGMPKSLRGLRLAKGDSVIKQSGQIMALCYGDRKTVTFLSTLFNAYVIYIQNRGLRTKITRVEFVMDLCRGLVGTYREDKGRPGRPRAIAMRRLTERHFIEMIEGKKRKRCTLCSKKIRTWCPSCGVGLCLTTCFKAFHTVGSVSRHGLEE
ncbi:hypothetical protein FSP39_000814 [Pinctada imbricata]|uniref:PiggyBac transposable element-derived protein domain-containing protein n=1 Tax=Pinctada imbricata TaxID=66713 RepID=A0AA88YKI5_PINIB|nr:hypothetical protein FSP39_000814 [Pinctada imbricata]